MKTLTVSSVVLALSLAACGADPTSSAEAKPAAVEADAAPTSAPTDQAFTPSSIPLSEAVQGDFPYLTAPQGFRAGEAKTLTLEQKYVFPADTVLAVEGRYYHTRIMVADSAEEWNETLMLSRLNQQIAAQGGQRMFDGPMPDEARVMLEAESPRFAKDLYDPAPYRFRQYAIRTDTAMIWIEIGYGYNAPMVDLTVVEQPLPEPESAPAA